MKSVSKARSKHKLSFAVNREDIDISSDWVQAIMQPASAPKSLREGGKAIVDEKTATVAENATVAAGATVENPATAAKNPTEENNATVENKTTVEKKATGARFGGRFIATVAENATVAQSGVPAGSALSPGKPVRIEQPATVVEKATVAENATVALSKRPAVAPARMLRLRPIRRVTDGLTPGQYAVYSLMYERGEEAIGSAARIYRGGYLDICRLTGLSKRGVQNVIAALQAKAVIGIEQAPGHHKSQTTIYRVASEQQVLESWFALGLRYAAGKSKNLIALGAEG